MKKLTKLALVGFLFLSITSLILLPMIQNQEELHLNEAVREKSAGEFVELSDGFVHYEISGPEEGDVVVLVHGFSAPMYIWEQLADNLAEVGFRVLKFDLYGRGYSDRPEVDYDIDLYVRQLDELLLALEIDSPFHLVGLSYSGPITARFTSDYPEKIRTLTLIDPMAAAVEDADIAPLNLPLLGEYIMAVYLAPVYLPESQSEDLKYPEKYSDWEERYRDQQQYSGWKRAILSSTREMVAFDPLEEYRKAGAGGVPVHLLWGEDDHLIPEERIMNVKTALGTAAFRKIADAGHLPFLDQPEVVLEILISQYLAAD